MNEGAVTKLLALLSAAYRYQLDAYTTEIYREMLAELDRFDVAEAAIKQLIREASRFPTVAEIRKAYFERLRSMPQPALDEPELTEEQRRENLARLRELADSIGVPIPDDAQRD